MSSRARHDVPADPATAYARAVLSGQVVAGELVKYAAERHVRDLADGAQRGLHFDPDRANKACRFFPSVLRITGGSKAGHPFNLLAYHGFLTASIYGWYWSDGRRRFREVYVETAKGQAKSPWMAGIGLYEMRFQGWPSAEVYAFAGNRKQARVLFMDAAAMVRATVPGTDETLEDWAGLVVRGEGDNAWKVEWDGTDDGLSTCKFEPVAVTTFASGFKPRCCLGDEVHEHKSGETIGMWRAALNKQAGDTLLILGSNTPAGNQATGIEVSNYFTDVVKGIHKDDASLAFIATVDKNDDPLKDESCWPKANPALGITYEVEKLRESVQNAVRKPGAAIKVKRLNFGIRTGAEDTWIEWHLWEAALDQFDEDALVGFPCYLGLDLSARRDLTALALVWDLGEEYRAAIRYWTPGATMVERAARDRAHYPDWVEAGHVIASDGPTIPKRMVADMVKGISSRHDVQCMAYDAAQILDFEEAATDADLKVWRWEGGEDEAGAGLKMVRHGQGPKNGMNSEKVLWMPRSVQETEEMLMTGKMLVQDNPVTTFCCANMTLVDDDGAGNRVPHRTKSNGRIDGMVAMMQAVGAAVRFKRAADTGFPDDYEMQVW